MKYKSDQRKQQQRAYRTFQIPDGSSVTYWDKVFRGLKSNILYCPSSPRNNDQMLLTQSCSKQKQNNNTSTYSNTSTIKNIQNSTQIQPKQPYNTKWLVKITLLNLEF